MRLSQRVLGELPSRVRVPGYDRGALTAGIVHFGVGNFHRAHMAAYLDALLDQGGSKDWAIVGAGVREADDIIRGRLEGQDWLTTLVEMDNAGAEARVVGSMIGHLRIGDSEGTLALLSDPKIRIVSLTITEGGYFIDPASGAFDPAHPSMLADAADPVGPKTIFGLLVAALTRRRAARVPAFTVVCCDNIPSNGLVTSRVVAGLAAMSDKGLVAWIEENVSFPNGMVDRITPATSDRERARLARDFGLTDAAPVFCETFRQWVLEDRFSAGRPEFERVGVTFVADVEPFERMKMRILNGGHAAIGYPAALLDLTFIHEATEDAEIAGFLRKLERDEILPVVPPVPDTDLDLYLDTVCSRFANRHIEDTATRVCFDGSNRQPKYIRPIVRDDLARGRPIAGLALVSAFWARYCFGETESGKTIAPNDPVWPRLNDRARAARNTPTSFLEMEDIVGELGRSPVYIKAFGAALSSLWALGTRRIIARYAHSDLA